MAKLEPGQKWRIKKIFNALRAWPIQIGDIVIIGNLDDRFSGYFNRRFNCSIEVDDPEHIGSTLIGFGHVEENGFEEQAELTTLTPEIIRI